MGKASKRTRATASGTRARGSSSKKATRGAKVPAGGAGRASTAAAKASTKAKKTTSAKAKKTASAKAKKTASARPKKTTSAKAKKAASAKAKKAASAKPKKAASARPKKAASARPKKAASVDAPSRSGAPDTRGQGRTRSHLRAGDPAPAFSLPADDGKTYSLDGLSGRRFVLYFYPKDSTPGCTQEACDFRDRRAAFDDRDVTVLGVSADSLRSHGSFREKYGLGFPLLSDPDREVADAYGALGEKTMYGQTKIGIIRSTFVVGPDGRLEHVFSPVRVTGHAEAVLQAIRAA